MLLVLVLFAAQNLPAQTIRLPWTGYAHDSQHDAIAPVQSQAINRIIWHTPVDLQPQYIGTSSNLWIHYGSPLITRSNTVIVPVKTGASQGFEVEALTGATGTTNWTIPTDYILPTYPAGLWTPSYSPVLTPKNRLYFAGAGGTVYYCDTPDLAGSTPVIGQIAFYGLANYIASSNTYKSTVYIDTPITSDRYGDIFFGFEVTGSNPLNLNSGIARIDFNGTGTWLAASNAAGSTSITEVVMNCSPTLSNDHRTLYIAVNGGANDFGYLTALDSRTLAPLQHALLKDVKTGNNASLDDNGTASPMVGPDGDVYYGVLGNPESANNDRGWLLHFNSTLTQLKIPGAFGWDDTASVVPASIVPSYHGNSAYLLMTKYNNYAGQGSGNGVNKIAVLDPDNSETDPISGKTVMQEVLTIAGPTPDPKNTNNFPNAVREWCINTAAVDPFSKSILANNEDGKMYRWDLTSNTLTQTNVLTGGIGEAYTPTIVGVDGTVYGINNGTLFAIGQ
jgi:hypothetical protein